MVCVIVDWPTKVKQSTRFSYVCVVRPIIFYIFNMNCKTKQKKRTAVKENEH